MSLATNLASVRQRIAQACARSGRDPSSITLVCVTKGIRPEAVREALAAGVCDLGENRVQEAREKQEHLGMQPQATSRKLQTETGSLQRGACSVQPVRWHLLGALQRNKVRRAVALFDVVHSVDAPSLIKELARQAGARTGHALDAFIQVNVSGEATKHGCRPEDVTQLAKELMTHSHMHLTGLMTIAPLSDNPEQARPHFRRLRELRDELAAAVSVQSATLRLSMGMSQDFEVAIEEGADLVRIGTAIFGAREPAHA